MARCNTSPCAILVADDDDFFRNLVEQLLTAAGYAVVGVINGAKALDAVKRTAFDAVVTDIVMPDMDGLELIRSLQRSKPALAVVAISGAARHSVLDFLPAAAAFGAVATLPKSRVIAELVPTLEDLLKAETA